MSEKRIKILYDATFLLNYSDRKAKRSGIYFVAYNILKELMNYPQFEITLYGNYRGIFYINEFMANNNLFSGCKILQPCQVCRGFTALVSKMNFICKKSDNSKDNLLKKVVRFFTFKYFALYERCSFHHKNFEKTVMNFDCYFSPYEPIPDEVLKNTRIKNFLFLHDAVPLVLNDFYKEMNFSKNWFAKVLKSINKKDYYFANSECTKQDFVKYAPEINPEKIIVTYLGANENFYQEKDSAKIAAVKEKYNIPQDKKYIFSLCTLEPRKNLAFAIKNFIEFIKKNKFNADAIAGQACNDESRAVDDFVFVLGGGHWDKFLPQLEKEITDLHEYKDKILKIGYVDDEDLAALYSGAEMFVYPSIYEGFGMPVLEAMQCGCPVITSNISSLPEVIGDCGIQIDPHSDEEMISAYEKMYFDKEFAAECSRKGLERAKMFTWKSCVDKIVEEILRKRP